jgi:chromatin segregation and condensation protein Rec8/ScpA/Scc1 (kleisin family)
MLLVMELLATADSVEFTQVFELADGAAPTRAVVVATFLAILELAKLEALRLYQGLSADGSPEGVIRLRSVEASGQVSWADRLVEEM